MNSVLLPTNASPWEMAMADAMPVSDAAVAAIGEMRRIKYVSPRPSMLPYLVWEYGLGELTPYVPNLYQLLDQGVRWQRLRGTVSAVAVGLAWIGYTAEVEDAWSGRRWWNSFQLRLPSLPVADFPDLDRIEGITRLSVPKRSQLRRGVYAYDVDAAQGDHRRFDNSLLDHESGIAVTQAGTIWSFGRTHEFPHTLTEEEGVAIGNWVEPSDEAINWIDLDYPWIDAAFNWIDDPELQRRAVMAAWFNERTIYLGLYDPEGAVIGYRRCRAAHSVGLAVNGAYAFNGRAHDPRPGGTLVYIEAMTQFEDSDGVNCASVALIVGAERTEGVKPGQLWLAPDQLSGGTAIVTKTVSVDLRATVREQFKFLIDFEVEPPPPSNPAATYDKNWFWL